MDCVVDTCILIYQETGREEYELYRPHLRGKRLGVSFQTYAELTIMPAFVSRWNELFFELKMAAILYPDQETARIWGALANEWKSLKGRNARIPTADLWHAALAIHYKVPLMTHNRRDFELFKKLELICEAP